MLQGRIIRDCDNSSGHRATRTRRWLSKRLLTLVSVAGLQAAGCQLVLGDLPENPEPDAHIDAEIEPIQEVDAEAEIDAAEAEVVELIDASLPSEADAADAAAEADAQADGELTVDPTACDGGPQQIYYRDRDNDGYGGAEQAVVACEPPAVGTWSTKGGDCNDRGPDVHPGQKEFFGGGYRLPENPQQLSFDYNCDGVELGKGGQDRAPDECVLGLLLCLGGGFVPSEARAAAPGINRYCGSNVLRSCIPSGLVCQEAIHTSDTKYLCN